MNVFQAGMADPHQPMHAHETSRTELSLYIDFRRKSVITQLFVSLSIGCRFLMMDLTVQKISLTPLLSSWFVS